MNKRELKERIMETRRLLRENPEVIEHLNPLQKKIAQALLREENKRGYAAAKREAGNKPAPSP